MPKKAKNGRGGAREGAGRPLTDDSGKKLPKTVWLSPGEIVHLEALGGTAAEGMRLLVAASIKAAARRGKRRPK